MANKKQKSRIVVEDYPFSLSTREILKLLSDGNYHITKGRSDQEPFKSFVKVNPEEISEYAEDGDEDSIEKYMEKKRNIPLQQFSALKLLGITVKKSRTTAATYSLSELGREIVSGLKLVKILKKYGLNMDEAIDAIKIYSESKKERPE